MPTSSTQDALPAVPTLLLRVALGGPQQKDYRFTTPFRIGRTEECDVCIKDEHVSRVHARTAYEDGGWWLYDLNSANGLIVNGERVPKVLLTNGITVRLGVRGLDVTFAVQDAPKPATPPVIQSLPVPEPIPVKVAATPPVATPVAKKPAEDYAAHYFGKLKEGETAGEHTMFIRSAFAQVQQKQKRKYGGVIAALVICAIALAGFGIRQYRRAHQQRLIAEQMFYSIKGLDVEIANLQEAVLLSNNQQEKQQLRSIENQRTQMEDSYNKFLASMHIYESNMNEQDRLILRVARIFGECEVDMPKDFRSEVMRYIKYWQSNQRLINDIKVANANGYTPKIARELMKQDLPPQFFYLAMQESDFNPLVSGPHTGVGIPKGMWQFMPQTAVHYGMRLGPLVDEQRPDVMDDRHHFDKETVAASKYLKDLYGSDAEASGLLVMACYNWGQPQVLRLVRSMPPNPRDRNFWMLLQKHRKEVPSETYDYVFRIVAAAVIGENPRLFGFHFDNPLAQAETGATQDMNGAPQG